MSMIELEWPIRVALLLFEICFYPAQLVQLVSLLNRLNIALCVPQHDCDNGNTYSDLAGAGDITWTIIDQYLRCHMASIGQSY